MNRDYEPVSEPVNYRVFVALDEQPAPQEHRKTEAFFDEPRFEAVPPCRRITRPDGANRLLGQPALPELTAGRRPRRGRELFPEPGGCHFVSFQQRLALALRFRVRAAVLGVGHREADARRQLPDRIREGQSVDELDELDDVAANPAPETVEHPFVPVHLKGGGLFAMERAAGLVLAA